MAVTRADKTTEIESLEGAFTGHDVAILIDYKGINVPQVTQLRSELRKAKATYKVVKNSLAKRALKGTQFESLSGQFEGMTAIAYTKDDPVALAKALTAYAKTNPSFTFKAGIVEGRAIDVKAINDLANIPSKEVIFAKLLYVINAPAQQLVTAMNAVGRNLAVVVDQGVKENKFSE